MLLFFLLYCISHVSLQQSELSSEERSERYGPLQQHRRAVGSLNKQIQQKTKQLEELQAKYAEVKTGCDDAKSNLLEATEHSQRLEKELKCSDEMEEQADSRWVVQCKPGTITHSLCRTQSALNMLCH
ncbi:coiled-coil domain-containing protein 93-like [Anarrhichthys ocellatus]|uniref:coiled-coil domain-containing protein 93-like n=1 Tax=Anarrhichthys ocellatus TaxID=433405 RepID=UPI0012EE4F70|nr:coiled-coil domain-containing protein 93-like [Anarrhichthys ocellatus]